MFCNLNMLEKTDKTIKSVLQRRLQNLRSEKHQELMDVDGSGLAGDVVASRCQLVSLQCCILYKLRSLWLRRVSH